ncbi:MAG: helix-turn-helix domain-containing protein [Terasakiella sp.]|uniref:helix-turn-helix domain-containing protein n=1 Tax=unclassified Terasakiella TaxID=2614952 RepID=UPI003B006D04
MKDIGQRFTEIRKNLGVTQKEFADRLGVSLGAVQGYEYGKVPKGEVLQVLLNMGFNLNWLVDGRGTMMRDQSQDVALNRMLMWNVAYFLSKRNETSEDAELYADAFMEIYDAMVRDSDMKKEDKESDISNIIDFSLRRLGK